MTLPVSDSKFGDNYFSDFSRKRSLSDPLEEKISSIVAGFFVSPPKRPLRVPQSGNDRLFTPPRSSVPTTDADYIHWRTPETSPEKGFFPFSPQPLGLNPLLETPVQSSPPQSPRSATRHVIERRDIHPSGLGLKQIDPKRLFRDKE
ncbi:MAG: hypothetical protein ACOYK9_03195 [Chlamydiia bacterium]